MATHRYRFGDWTFDPCAGDLDGPEGRRRLEPQPARVLEMLADAGGLVTREELRDALWGDTEVEFDQGIHYCVRQIRAALGDRAAQPRFVETLPRRGYRLMVPAERIEGRSRPRVTPGAARGRRVLALGLLAGAVAAALTLGLLADGPPPPENAAEADPGPPRATSVAILALERPADAASAALLDDLLERLVVELTAATRPRLAVVGPATTAPYAGSPRPQPEIGRELGVDHVLSCAVREMDDVVFCQVVRTTDGAHVFARRLAAATPADELADAVAIGALEALVEPAGRAAVGRNLAREPT